MKKILQFLVLSIIISGFISCIDEEDFDFNSLAQTTITPSVNAPLINTEILLKDFLDIEALSDTANGFEIIQINQESDSYLEFVFSSKDIYNVEEFVEQINDVDDIEVTITDLNIPDVSDLGLEFNEAFEISFSYPDTSVASEDLSIEIEKFDNQVHIDSVHILSGGIRIQPTNSIPLNTYIELTSSNIRNKVTGELLSERLQISNSNSNIIQEIDFSDYAISLKDSIVNDSTKQFIDLRYRLFFDLSSNNLFEGGMYDVNFNLSLIPLMIDAIFGDMGDTEFNIRDVIALDFFKDSLLNSITSNNSIDFEKLYIHFFISTNIGIDMNITPNIFTTTSNGNTYSVFNNEGYIHVNGADLLGNIGYTNDIVLESDANAVEVFPDSLVYDLKFDFKDQKIKNSTYNFVSPEDAFIGIDAKAVLPFKAKLKDLLYETEFNAFEFIEELNYLQSTTLNFYLENTFPAELSVDFYLVDSNNVVFDTLLISPFRISGAIVDNQGHILSPSSENVNITLENSKYESLKKASKIKLSAILNTSKDEEGTQPYVRFSNDANIKIKASVSATGNITF
jgi:hypothetical protein